MIKSFQITLAALVVGFGLAAALTILAVELADLEPDLADAQTAQLAIAFPIAELGNCANKQDCKDYCNLPENMPACIDFASQHNLMDEQQATHARQFARKLQASEGPLGCQNPAECKIVCSDINNIDACLAWAEQNDIRDKHFDEAKKIQAYLKAGGQMPGGCSSQADCQEYCENFEHAEECFSFAQEADLDIHDDDDGPPPRQVLELIKTGQTPGGCTSKQECESYCELEEHGEECVNFALKAGFMQPEEAARLRKIGFKGPGGCHGKKACETYCNEPANQESCFNFAKEHGLIPERELQQIKEGLARMRAGLEQAPEEVKQCLREKLGQNIIADIQAGALTPGPRIGDTVRDCFEQFGGSHRPQELLDQAPPEVLSCLEAKGITIEQLKNGELEFTPEIGDLFRVCFQSVQLEQGPFEQGGQVQPAQAMHNFAEFMRSAPVDIKPCLEQSLGADLEALQSSQLLPGPELSQKVKACFEQFSQRRMRDFQDNPPDYIQRPDLGPEQQACIKELLSPEEFASLQAGQYGPELKERIRTCFERHEQEGYKPQYNPTEQQFERITNSTGLPPRVLECLKQKLDGEQLERLLRGEQPAVQVQEALQSCFDQNTRSQSLEPKIFQPLAPMMERRTETMPRPDSNEQAPETNQENLVLPVEKPVPEQPSSFMGRFMAALVKLLLR